MIADDAHTIVEHANADRLLAALGAGIPRHNRGGWCPECGEPAYAPDTATWRCGRGHHGTVWRLRRAVLEDPAALHRLAGEPVRGGIWPEDAEPLAPTPEPFWPTEAA